MTSATTIGRKRGILFSAPMVTAILAGRKTQTRRVIKPQPVGGFAGVCADGTAFGATCSPQENVRMDRCPYGVAGDRLWVRETWMQPLPEEKTIWYRADADATAEAFTQGCWRPSIFMPRWASRITLEVVAVRVERLNDISEADARAEGVAEIATREMQSDSTIRPLVISARSVFQSLWSDINGAGSWSANPWVWVIEFSRIEP